MNQQPNNHGYGLVEKWVIVGLLGLLTGFALLQVILRNFFSTGFVWGDTLLRHGVLWVGLLGASRATAENGHIRIDLLTRLLPRGMHRPLRMLGGGLSAGVAGMLCIASLRFIQSERMAGTVALPGVPLWWLELIFPVAFAVMTVRFIRLMAVDSKGEGRPTP